jgi:hypothetical protein
MDWEAANAIAEVVAAFGVILSLLYVAAQVKHNTRAVETSTHQQLSQHALTVGTTLVQSGEVADLVVRGEAGDDALTPAEQRRFFEYCITVFGNWEAAYLHRQNGIINDELWQAWDGYYRLHFPSPGLARFWEGARSGHAPSFRDYIDGMLTEEGGPPR